ncbi:hypothetical protein [Legionella gresilensis]|uniref:hypothetical protein n=1 Tax=Legionella gresilensis TaxID=91823 RepID=UPI0010416E86|nr:hypothetical protein [Legionella gresilensis]
MYIINEYQLQTVNSTTYIFSDTKAAKIPSKVLYEVLKELQQQQKFEISESALLALATRFQISLEQLKFVLINQLDILRPLASRKFRKIYLNIDDTLIGELLSDSFQDTYHVKNVTKDFSDYDKESLVIFYRNNYSSPEFKQLFQDLPDNVYLITAGIIHKILVIDNLYFNDCGLPTHLSNLHQLMAFLNSDISVTKDNWLLFYRSMLKNGVDVFPQPSVNACQKGFVAYTLYQFASQYTHFWKAQLPLDKINWFWHADLTSFNVHQEIAIHSAFSEYDMKINSTHLKQAELV